MPPTPNGTDKRTTAIIVAAGRGTRASGQNTEPKQYVNIFGRAVLWHTLRPFLTHPQIDQILVVIHPDDQHLYADAIPEGANKLLPPAHGGATRQASVLNGLAALADDPPSHVVIHDAARPFVTADVISGILGRLSDTPGAIAALPVVDTLKRALPADRIEQTVDRTHLWRASTPQAFRFHDIYQAHRAAERSQRDNFTDDASIAEFAGHAVALVEDDPTNIKITTPGDFALAERLLRQPSPETRVGQGFDVHSFTTGSHVTLCGVDIPHDAALKGHSDADVAMHAITDALLGAIADGDIGQHFPPTDPQWAGAASHIFLEDAARRVQQRGGQITSIDVTIVCEAPKIGPHRDAMRERLAEILALDVSRIAVKATTSERLGFTGRREGIAALATATVALN